MPSTLRSNCFSVIIRVIRLIRGRPRDAGGCKGLTTNGILADRSTGRDAIVCNARGRGGMMSVVGQRFGVTVGSIARVPRKAKTEN